MNDQLKRFSLQNVNSRACMLIISLLVFFDNCSQNQVGKSGSPKTSGSCFWKHRLVDVSESLELWSILFSWHCTGIGSIPEFFWEPKRELPRFLLCMTIMECCKKVLKTWQVKKKKIKNTWRCLHELNQSNVNKHKQAKKKVGMLTAYILNLGIHISEDCSNQ